MTRTLQHYAPNTKRKALGRLAEKLGLLPVRKPAETSSAPQTYRVGKSTVHVGRHTYGHNGLTVRQWNEGANLSIGPFCSIADAVTVFLGGNHRTDWITTYPFGHVPGGLADLAPVAGHPATRGDVTIGADVWLGSGCTLLSGVTVAHGAVIAAGTLVHRDVAPYEIVGGNPCASLGFRFDTATIDALLASAWWDCDDATIRSLVPTLCNTPTPERLAAIAQKDPGL